MPSTNEFGFIHCFVPGEGTGSRPVTLLLLQGTAGGENELLPLGRELWPGAALLSVSGKAVENGKPQFFRRPADGVIDVADLRLRTDDLSEFIDTASQRYGFSTKNLIGVGYSDGANIAASLILLHPHHLALAILFRVRVPLEPAIIRNFSNLSVFIGAGLHDETVGRDQPERLAAILRSGGADVTIFWHGGGHELGSEDVQAARIWLSNDNIRKKAEA